MPANPSLLRCSTHGVRIVTASLFLLMLLPAMMSPPNSHAQEVPELGINSKRYIVIDADTGEIFAQRGAHDRVAIASLTKIFTAIEALERGSLDQRITTKPSDVFDSRSTRMGFGAGETFTLRDLLYGMMLPSGNDAAHAIARALGYREGDSDEEAVNRFIGYMNQRIRNMGLTDTNLLNPHGWGVEGHYSSAHDVAAFMRYALKYPVFVELISTPRYTTSNGAYVLTNTNKMLHTYQGIIGGKTGYDDDAGYCLVEVARRSGSTMISVTLDGIAPDDWYDDNRVLLDYAFTQKARRIAENRPILGEIVTFRDPDAAVIEQIATSGASIGLPSTPPPPSPIVATPPATPSPPAVAMDGVAARSGDGTNMKLLVTVAVAAIVIAAGVLGGIVGRPAAEPRPTDRASEPSP